MNTWDELNTKTLCSRTSSTRLARILYSAYLVWDVYTRASVYEQGEQHLRWIIKYIMCVVGRARWNFKEKEEGDDTTTFSATTLAVGCGGDEEGDRFLRREREREREMGQ